MPKTEQAIQTVDYDETTLPLLEHQSEDIPEVTPVRISPAQPAPDAIHSLIQLNLSAQQRIFQAHCEYLGAWSKWVYRCAHLRQANTMSKLAEQEINLFMSAGQIIGNQFVNLTNLQENFQVNYGYWLEQHLRS
jgi:L-lysine 2,3-aminomutase